MIDGFVNVFGDFLCFSSACSAAFLKVLSAFVLLSTFVQFVFVAGKEIPIVCNLSSTISCSSSSPMIAWNSTADGSRLGFVI